MIETTSSKRTATFLLSFAFACLVASCSPTPNSDGNKANDGSDAGSSESLDAREKANSQIRLDGTNSDTLIASLREAIAKMTEADRMALAQDLQLIYWKADGGESSPYSLRRDLFPEANLNSLNYSDIALLVGEQITDKTPADVHSLASSIREEVLLERIDDLLAEIDAEDVRARVQIICTQNAMNPEVNPGGYRATGWGWTLQACQSRVAQLPALRDEIISEKKRIGSFDFTETSFDTDANFEVFARLDKLKADTPRCSRNGAFCPADAEPRARQQSTGGETDRDISAFLEHCAATGLGQAVCECREDAIRSQLSSALMTALEAMAEMDDESATKKFYELSPTDQEKLMGAQDVADSTCG